MITDAGSGAQLLEIRFVFLTAPVSELLRPQLLGASPLRHRGLSVAMGMCIGKKQLPDPNDLSRPADVPCAKCGEFNYIEEKKTAVKCFNCGERVFRGLPGAEGMESAQEHSDKLPRSTNTQQFTLTGI